MTGTSNEASETAAESSDAGFDPLPEKVRRSIKWNTEVLAQILKQLVASRETSQSSDISATNATSEAKDDMVPLDEVAEVITLPAFTATKKSCTIRDLEFMVQDQLKDYVTAIALLHRGNPFHNFEVSVTMRSVYAPERVLCADRFYNLGWVCVCVCVSCYKSNSHPTYFSDTARLPYGNERCEAPGANHRCQGARQ